MRKGSQHSEERESTSEERGRVNIVRKGEST